MPERPVLEDGLTPPPVQPAATPVDTFVRTNAGEQLGQLAQGLSKFSQGLEQYYTVEQKKENEEDIAAGQAAARDALHKNIKTLNDAIKAGVIGPEKSPFFRAAAQEQFGRVAAGQMESDLRVAAATDDTLLTSTDPADFDKWYNEQRKNWLDTKLGSDAQDNFFQAGFGHASEVYYQQARNEFSEIAAQRLQKQYGDGHFQETYTAIQTMTAAGRSKEDVANAINDLLKVGVAANPKAGRLLNEATVKAVATYARSVEDPSFLDILKFTKGGSGTLDTTSYGSAAIIEARHDIAMALQEKYSFENAQANRARREGTRQALIAATDILEKADDPAQVDLKNLKRQLLSADNPDGVKALENLQDAYVKHQYRDDPDTAADLFRRIHYTEDGEQPTTIEEASSALGDGRLSIQTYRSIISDLQAAEKDGGKAGQKYVHDPLLKQARDETKTLFISEFGFEAPQMRQRASEAVDDVTFRYIKWREGAGKDATEIQQREFLKKAKEEVFSKYSDHGAISDKSKVPQSPASIGSASPPPVDWHNAPATDASNISALEREVAEMKAGKRNSFSRASVMVLQANGIKADQKAIDEFIAAQRRFYPAPAQDSTSQ